MLVRKLLLLLSVYFLNSSVCGEQGCPPSEEIKPCTCIEEYGAADLTCEGITDMDKLLKVFHNAERYNIFQFSLIESTLQYLPQVIFNDISVKYMMLKNVTLINFFDEIPQNPGLEKIFIYWVKIVGGWDWTKLSVFQELEELSIDHVSIKKFSTDFRPNISKNLKHLSLSWCQLKKLRDGEFQEFTQLTSFTATDNNINTVSRKMFSRPSKLFLLSFQYNQIESIPEDMFIDMPDLKTINFANNHLTLLPEKTFVSVIDHINQLWFQGNPIQCDCRIRWLTFISEDLKLLNGMCDSPSNMKMKKLKDLTPEDFRC